MAAYNYPNPQAIFYQQYEAVRRDEVVGVLLALFLGGFGAHHFYLRRTGLGVLYLLFSWTPIPWILGFFGCFFMPGRVRVFNAIEAASIAAFLGITVSPWGHPINVTVNVPQQPEAAPQEAQNGITTGILAACSRCQQVNSAGSSFCSTCGARL